MAMPRRLQSPSIRLGLVAALLFGGAAPTLLHLPLNVARAQIASPESTVKPLDVAQARVAATKVLEAVQRGDAKARFDQFAPELQAVTSPTMIAATMRAQPKVLKFRLLSVQTGISTSTVEADLTTTAGERTVFLVLNGKGKILRYYFDRADDSTSKVALQFVQAISTGNFITAHSFLNPELQKEISPAVLQSKWQNLQSQTGLFVRVGRAVEAESTLDQHLVLVNVQFNRLSDNLFLVLNASNQITGIDFPEISALTGPVP